jgi:predicted DsbA family dithiol-disulfide isomerase
LDELFAKKGMPIDVDKVMAQLKAKADSLGLEFGNRKKTYNSRLAQEVGLWAQTKGKGHQFHMEAFKSYFVKGENIAKKDVLLSLIQRSGLDPKEGESVIDTRLFSNAVDSDWKLSRNIGVTAVPTFKLGLDTIVGAQPYEALKKMVEKYVGRGH